MKDNNLIVDKLTQSWISPYVSRTEVSKFSGGIVSPKTLANADSEGNGPQNKYYFGKRKVFYPKIDLANWIAARVTL